MPKMDGFTFLRVVMSKRPTPVMVISGRSGEDDVFKALELGAVDFIAKPTPHAAPELVNIEQELIRKVHTIRQLRIEKVGKRLREMPATVARRGGIWEKDSPSIVVIGSSTGGPAALMQIFGAFPEAPPCAFLVAQHMPTGFTRGFAERLDRLTGFRAFEAKGGEIPEPGTILVAPGGCHLEVERCARAVMTRVVPPTPADKYTPSVDRLFQSAAKCFGRDVLAVVLTGMGDDGRMGVKSVKEAGGRVIAESEDTAVIFGMPQQAIRTGVVDRVLALGDIATAIEMGIGSVMARAATGKGLV
jgi:two-component system chemotaxis response regulator CheB